MRRKKGRTVLRNKEIGERNEKSADESGTYSDCDDACFGVSFSSVRRRNGYSCADSRISMTSSSPENSTATVSERKNSADVEMTATTAVPMNAHDTILLTRS